MYNVIIVDDEQATTEYITAYINELTPHFNVLETFDNGKDAAEFLKKNQVDLVITDVRMPKMDGIELSAYIYENFPNTFIIVVSAYEEFEYARQCIQYGVLDFLTKIVSPNDFLRAMKTAEKKLSEKENKRIILPNDTKEFFQKYILGICDESDKLCFKDRINSTSIHEISVTTLWLDISNLAECINNNFRSSLSHFTAAIENIIYLCYPDFPLLYLTQRNNITILSIAHPQHITPDFSMFKSQVSKLFNLNFKICKKQFNRLTEFFNSDIYNMISYSDIEKLLNSYILINKIENAQNLYKKINAYKDCPVEIKRNIKSIIESSLLDTSKCRQNIIDTKVENAKQYINEHYSENISVSDVANYVSLSTEYFSRYFKMHTGYTPLDYIYATRMEEAANMIKKKIPIGEVAKKVGYTTERHFRRRFKVYWGCSPSEFIRIKQQ